MVKTFEKCYNSFPPCSLLGLLHNKNQITVDLQMIWSGKQQICICTTRVCACVRVCEVVIGRLGRSYFSTEFLPHESHREMQAYNLVTEQWSERFMASY